MIRFIAITIAITFSSIFYIGVLSITSMENMGDMEDHACPMANVINTSCVGDADVLAMITSHLRALTSQLTSLASVNIFEFFFVYLIISLFLLKDVVRIPYLYWYTRREPESHVLVWQKILRWLAINNKGNLPHYFFGRAYIPIIV
ncbi:MAG: hypothetical protein COX81_03790 [Candidatus Magasanikbacteria bacterium CG_4_10_14_0_2_um_filter_37_12]|uniref:Uncharacterized protein n=1 Tax=Candidatus Magasanikbacteria bacterium CG_4_10_14_0_2_um_filter_37_12 TaxID=1974637 RepID=A0A2M7V6N0_9BACT|nr:MAG: hypothetical protein COX81_03790 [Candidatus Magasanikbacteria bacterium CG_4_10_14_0_2_um_filter_37_12]